MDQCKKRKELKLSVYVLVSKLLTAEIGHLERSLLNADASRNAVQHTKTKNMKGKRDKNKYVYKRKKKIGNNISNI